MTGRRIIIAGGTGLIGRAVARALADRGADVVVLTRTPDASPAVGRHVRWDGKTLDARRTREVDGADAVINLAGKNVNCRYAPAALAEIDASRVDAVVAMNTAVAGQRPAVHQLDPRRRPHRPRRARGGGRGVSCCEPNPSSPSRAGGCCPKRLRLPCVVGAIGV